MAVNFSIDADRVRVIGEDGKQYGILSLTEAVGKAREQGLDLVLMSSSSSPPVCKVMDYGKHKYMAQKKANAAKKRQHSIQVKEVKIGSNTDRHDFEVKLKNARRFLDGGDKVKLSLRFRGREMAYKERGLEQLKAMAGKLEDLGKVERMPLLEGRQMTMVIAPLKNKKSLQ